MSKEKQEKAKGKFYTLFIDDIEYHVDKPELTGKEIMDLGGIPYEVGLLLILEDGTQVQVGEDEVIKLKLGRRFKKAPRFKRG